MNSRKVVLTALLLLLVGVEAIVLAQWVSFPYWPAEAMLLADAHDFVYGALMPLSPLVLVWVLYGRPFAYLVGKARRSTRLGPQVRFLTDPIASQVRVLRSIDLKGAVESVTVLKHPRLLLALSIVLSAVVAYMPYRPEINPSGALVGVDSPRYEHWLSQMLDRSFTDSMGYAFGQATQDAGPLPGSRPLLLIPMYLVSVIGGFPAPTVVRALPIFLAPLLSVSTFLFIRYGYGSEQVAALAALMTAFSFNLTVGIWAGYYANWLALAEAYLFLTGLLLFSKSFSFPKFLGLMLLSVTILLTHPWTWVLVMAVCLVFTASVARESRQPAHVWFTITLASTGVMVDFFKNLSFGSATVAGDIATKTPLFGLSQLALFWPNLINMLLYTHEGLMANAVFLGLAAVPVFTMKLEDRFQRLIILWVLLAGVPFAFFESYHQARILYDLPIPVLMVLGTIQLVHAREESLRRIALVILLVTMFGLNYALRAMLQL